MFFHKLFLIRFAGLLSLTLLAGGCAAEHKDPRLERVETALALCKSRLAEGRYEDAHQASAKFIDSGTDDLEVDDVAVDRLRFCYAMAQTLSQVDHVSQSIADVMRFFDNMSNTRGTGENTGAPSFRPQSASLDTYVSNVFKPVVDVLESNRAQYEAILAKGRFTWKLEKLPVSVNGDELFDARGSYDLAEIEMLSTFTRSLLALVYVLESNNYELNVPVLLAYGKVDGSPLMNSQQRPLYAFMNMLAVMLATHPDFLTLSEQDGAGLVKNAGAELGAAAEALVDAVEFMRSRPRGEGTHHIFETIQDTNGESLVVHIQFEHNLTDDVELEKLNNVSFPLSEDTEAAIAHVKNSLAAGGGVRASFQKDVLPLFAMLVGAVVRTGAFNAVLIDAASRIDPALAGKVHALLASGGGAVTALYADGVLAFPADMELDLGAFFAHPVDLRSLFPAWSLPASASSSTEAYLQSLKSVMFVYEYECSDPIINSATDIFCHNPVDQAHFNNPVSLDTTVQNVLVQGPIQADGILSPAPAFLFKDPTFNGLLYIDPTTMSSPALATETGMRPANLVTLNAVIAAYGVESVALFK